MDWRYYIFKKTGFLFYTKETSGKTLEFIGTSGVGKTTLFREIVKKIRNRWLFSYHLNSLTRKAPPCEVDDILMRILKSRIESINNSDSFCPWHSFLDLKLSVRVMYETMLIAHSTFPKGFAFDEGLFRHFPAEILQLGDEFPDQLWKNRAFVYLRSRTPETILSRLKSREITEAQVESQRVRTDDQILSGIIQDQEMFQSIVDKARSFGCPVLVITAEDPLQGSINKVLDFENSLSKSFRVQQNMGTGGKPLSIKQ